ncbi:MAG: YihY/virulence factor BrkB family protein [Deltaproteobacteria bacterium]|nr:YihY/virulence factor BrkB family protein [Deltaproteobacteria bacterium]
MLRAHELLTWLGRLWRFSVRVVRAFLRNRGILLAGGVGYNALLSLVPFLTITVAALSWFFDEERILGILRSELPMLVPQHADTLLQTAQSFLQHRAATGLVSVAVLLFFSSVAFRMLEEAMAGIFPASGKGSGRKFWVSALLPYVFIVPLMFALFLMTLLTIGLDALGDGTVRIFGVAWSLAHSVNRLLRVAGFLGVVGLFAGLYRILPVAKVSLRRALIGGLCAAVLWRVAGIVMAYYFTNLSTVNVVYGSLATVVVVLLFLEVAFIILLLGAQVIAELEASAAAGVAWHQPPPPGPSK